MNWREQILPFCQRGGCFQVARKIQDLHPLSSVKTTAFDCLPPNRLQYEPGLAKLAVGIHHEDLTWTLYVRDRPVAYGSIRTEGAHLNHVLAALAELTEAFA